MTKINHARLNKDFILARQEKAKHCKKCERVIVSGNKNKSGYCSNCLNEHDVRNRHKTKKE